MRSRPSRASLPLALALVALLSASRAAAQSPSAQALEALAGPLYQQLATLKGMASPGPPPPILVKSRAETRRFIEQELERRYSAPRLESERKGMVAWGLIPGDYDLRRLFVDLMEEQIAAYYDPRTKVLVVGDWLPAEQQQAALMHELVHALQDRLVPLDAFIAPRAGEGDQLLARQALVEGEAVALTLELVLRANGTDLSSLPDLGPLRSAVEAGTLGPTIGAAPKFLRDLLLFPYVDGLGFVHQFRRRAPWSAITGLYRDPPRSTAQIMNPAKRLVAREDPVLVTLPDLGTLAPGVKVVAEDELGEFALRAVLAQRAGADAAELGAGGWRGDRYRVWEDGDATLLLAYRLVMESESAATRFAKTYADTVEKRHPALSGAGRRSATLVTWRVGDRAFAVEQRAAEVLVLEQIPAGALDGARETIWRSRPALPRP